MTDDKALDASKASLALLMHRYLGGLMDPFVTLLEAHKLMYFMHEAGEPLRSRYAKAPYGPYAENLTHVFRASPICSTRPPTIPVSRRCVAANSSAVLSGSAQFTANVERRLGRSVAPGWRGRKPKDVAGDNGC